MFSSIQRDQFLFGQTRNISTLLTTKLAKTHTLKSHSGCVNSLAFNQTGSCLVSASDDLMLSIWAYNNHSLTLKTSIRSGHNSNIFSAKFLLDNNKLVSSAADGNVIYSDINDSTAINSEIIPNSINSFQCHSGMGLEVIVDLINPNSIFFSCSNDGTVNRYDLRIKEKCLCKNCNDHLLFDINQTNPKSKSKYRHFNLFHYGLESSTWGKRATSIFGISSIDIDKSMPTTMLVGGSDDSIRLYDIRKADLPFFYFQPEAVRPDDLLSNESRKFRNISSCKFTPSGQVLVSFSGTEIMIVDIEKESVVSTFTGHRNSMTMVVSGSDDGNIFFWDTKTTKIVNILKGDSSIVNCICPHPFDPILATSGIDDDIKIWAPNMRVSEEENEEKLDIKKVVDDNLKFVQEDSDDDDDDDDDDGNLAPILMRMLAARALFFSQDREFLDFYGDRDVNTSGEEEGNDEIEIEEGESEDEEVV